MAEKHYCLEEALVTQGGVFNQTYDLTIVNVGETKAVTFGNGEQHKVQALKVSDGTAEIRWSIFDPTQIFTEGMGVHLEAVYIKEKDGYTDLKVAKKGADKIKFSETSEVKSAPKKAKKGDIPIDEVRHILDEIFVILRNIEKMMKEQKGE